MGRARLRSLLAVAAAVATVAVVLAGSASAGDGGTHAARADAPRCAIINAKESSTGPKVQWGIYRDRGRVSCHRAKQVLRRVLNRNARVRHRKGYPYFVVGRWRCPNGFTGYQACHVGKPFAKNAKRQIHAQACGTPGCPARSQF